MGAGGDGEGSDNLRRRLNESQDGRSRLQEENLRLQQEVQRISQDNTNNFRPKNIFFQKQLQLKSRNIYSRF